MTDAVLTAAMSRKCRHKQAEENNWGSTLNDRRTGEMSNAAVVIVLRVWTQEIQITVVVNDEAGGEWSSEAVSGTLPGLCEVKVDKSLEYAPFRSWTFLNCSSSCDTVSWESRLKKRNTTRGTGWISTEVEIVDWKKSNISCTYGATDGTTIEDQVTIIPYALPTSVTIDLEEMLEEGKSHNITCTIYKVAPVENLKVTVTRGRSVIYEKSFVGDPREGETDITEIHQITAQRGDNLQDFSCNAILNLGTSSYIDNKVSSSSVTVRTFALPEEPKIVSSQWNEKTTTYTAKCVVSQAFPPDNVTLEMSFNKTPLSVIITERTESTVMGIADIPPSTFSVIGKHNLNCRAEVFGKVKESELDLNIYEHPEMNFTFSNTSVVLGNSVKASYRPQFSLCSDSVIWVEGDQNGFSCRANGNPIPEVTCSDGRWTARADESFKITRNFTSVYECSASNMQGNATKDINVTVQYSDKKKIWIIPVVILALVILIAVGFGIKKKCATPDKSPGETATDIPHHRTSSL
ncbi:intercellular adhesion molecule 5-like [Rhinophrynus dorsalis]